MLLIGNVLKINIKAIIIQLIFCQSNTTNDDEC